VTAKETPTTKYTVVRDGVVIDGKEYGLGETVALADVDAQWLIRDGMVREVAR
jgi:hypothetical protein